LDEPWFSSLLPGLGVRLKGHQDPQKVRDYCVVGAECLATKGAKERQMTVLPLEPPETWADVKDLP